ncbi:hypothetical protein AAVH_15887 [Aphelenchoides avenae]|nr:hypothetical protein AAVH_15887 [Aphelenchus avenae]
MASTFTKLIKSAPTDLEKHTATPLTDLAASAEALGQRNELYFAGATELVTVRTQRDEPRTEPGRSYLLDDDFCAATPSCSSSSVA